MLSPKILTLSEPYNIIKPLPLDLHGWFSEKNKIHLQELILSKKPQVIVEIGVWCGKSSIFMGNLVKDYGKVYAIDHWLGQSYYTSSLSPEIATRMPIAYHQFLSNLIHTNLTNVVIPIRMSSMEAAKALDIQPDLIYIDGSHVAEDVYNDIIHWHKKLNVEGIICGDDWRSNEVRKGIVQAAKELKYTIYAVENFWMLEY